MLNLSAIVQDTRYGIVKSGALSWTLQDENGVVQARGTLTFSNGSWRGQQILLRGLPAGKNKVYYNIISDRGRTGSAIGELQVRVKQPQSTITGVVRDAADGKPLPDSSVLLFDGTRLYRLIRLLLSNTVPDLKLLTANLPVIRSATSDSNGRFSLNEVPPGVYNVVAGKEAYIPGSSLSAVVAADSGTINRDVFLSSETSLGALQGNINGLFLACQQVLDHNAEIMGQMTSKVQSDDIYGNGDGLDKFSKIASDVSLFGSLLAPSIELSRLNNAIGGVSAETFEKSIRAIGLKALGKGLEKLEKKAFNDFNNRLKNDLIKKEFPLDKAGFQASEYHTVFINQIAQIRTNFNNQAGSVPLNSEFEIEKAKQILAEISTNLNDASSGKVVFLASPLPTEGVGMLKLDTMKRNYDILSNQQKLGFFRNSGGKPSYLVVYKP